MLSSEVCCNYNSPVVFPLRFFAWPISDLTHLIFSPRNWDEQVTPDCIIFSSSLTSLWGCESPKLFWRDSFMVWGSVLSLNNLTAFSDLTPKHLRPPYILSPPISTLGYTHTNTKTNHTRRHTTNIHARRGVETHTNIHTHRHTPGTRKKTNSHAHIRTHDTHTRGARARSLTHNFSV